MDWREHSTRIRWLLAVATGLMIAYDPLLLALKVFGLAQLMRDHPELFSPQAALESVQEALLDSGFTACDMAADIASGAAATSWQR